jgi:hypothetical protein
MSGGADVSTKLTVVARQITVTGYGSFAVARGGARIARFLYN